MILSKLILTYVKIGYRIKYGEKLKGFAYVFDFTPKFIQKKREKKIEAFYERAKRILKPSNHNLEDVAAYVAEKYGAVIYEPDPKERDYVILNLMYSMYEDRLNQAGPVKRSLVEQVRHLEERSKSMGSLSPELRAICETLEVDPVFYRYPRTKGYSDFKGPFVSIAMDHKSSYLSISGASLEDTLDIYKYRGLSQEDIAETSPWFKSLALMLRAQGELE